MNIVGPYAVKVVSFPQIHYHAAIVVEVCPSHIAGDPL